MWKFFAAEALLLFVAAAVPISAFDTRRSVADLRMPITRLHAHHTIGSRRDVFNAVAAGAFSILVARPRPSDASITDETETFGNTAEDSAYRDGFEGFVKQQQQQRPPPQSIKETSDEVSIQVTKADLQKGLGLELGQVEFRTNIRVVVKSILPDSPAERLGIQKNWVVVGVNGQSAERTNADGVALMVSRATKALKGSETFELRFRDPVIFQDRLRNLQDGGQVTTQIAPAGSINASGVAKSQSDQRLTVSQLIPPRMCNRGATTDDLLEISYLGSVVETGAVFDGSAIKVNGQAVPGRGNDVSLFFVLGKQPFGQFPPGWDVGLEGMCVGERRRLIVPPVLAYGATGVPKRGIPPNATLQYDITLISINGLAMPQ